MTFIDPKIQDAMGKLYSKPLTEKESLLKQIVNIMKEFDNKEGDIPIQNEYWTLLNLYRGMKNVR